jgi:DNA-binding response OmpR family regulator
LAPDVERVTRPKILVVDDEPFNVDFLAQELDDLGYAVVTAADGAEALERVRAEAPDLVLLDIMMPVLDGFAVLERLKADAATRELPVVIISAVNDLASIVRGLRAGADDWLGKPFEPVLLEARIRSGLARKLQRDREVEYLRQVERLTAAAQAMHESAYDEGLLAPVAARDDALGDLARVFRSMAREVVAREQRLLRQLAQLQLDIAERRANARDTLASYVARDRRHALACGEALPGTSTGTALFADISGFTPLTEAFVRELGARRGAEEVTRQVNRVLGSLIDCVHRFRGSVVGFGGDAITCWFDGEHAARAAACAAAMQRAMGAFAAITAPGGLDVSLGLKVALAHGTARRMLVGDPRLQQLDVVGGHVMDELATAERQARRGEVVATRRALAALPRACRLRAWRGDCAVVDVDESAAAPCPWPEDSERLDDAQAQAFVAAGVRERVRDGQGEFLAELRPAVSVFVRFAGIDFDADAEAEQKLDALARFAQEIAHAHDGTLLQLALGDKGSHFHVGFGVPVAHDDDDLRAVRSALSLVHASSRFPFVGAIAAGVARGPIRAGAYGSSARRAYSVMGDSVNLAVRLMTKAANGDVLCDAGVYEAARASMAFEALPAIAVKGKSKRVAVYRPLSGTRGDESRSDVAARIDRLPATEQAVLKVASVVGSTFALEALEAVFPDAGERPTLRKRVHALVAEGVVVPVDGDLQDVFAFASPVVHAAAYDRMLFAQRRQLHRAVAEWHEAAHGDDLAPYYATLAQQWQAADEPGRASDYFEKAGAHAREHGALDEAQRYFDESLAIERAGAVLSRAYVK